MAETLINDLSDPTLWEGGNGTFTEWEDFMVDEKPSTMLNVSGGSPVSVTFPDPIDLTGYTQVSMVAASFRLAGRAANSAYTFKLDDVEYKVSLSKNMSRISFPLVEGVDSLSKLEISLDSPSQSDILVVSHLIAVNPEMPTDLLHAFKRGIEREISRGESFLVGSINCQKGDSRVILEEQWDWLERNVVLRIGDELHQIANRVDNYVTFMTTYDGEKMLNSYLGDVFVQLPVEIGYYDREIALPGVALWYNSPTPAERHGLVNTDLIAVIDGEDFVEERQGQTMTWKVTMEIAARSPQLVQAAARAVRTFLGKSVAWVNGVKLWWQWKIPVADSEPLADYDIVPRANYGVEIEVREKVWEIKRQVNLRRRNLKVYPTDR